MDYIAHIINFILLTHLFCKWMFTPLNLAHLFLSSMHSLPSGNHCVCSLYLQLCFCLVMSVHLLCFFKSPHVSEIIQHLSFSVYRVSLSIIHSRSIHVVANSKISFLFIEPPGFKMIQRKMRLTVLICTSEWQRGNQALWTEQSFSLPIACSLGQVHCCLAVQRARIQLLQDCFSSLNYSYLTAMLGRCNETCKVSIKQDLTHSSGMM